MDEDNKEFDVLQSSELEANNAQTTALEALEDTMSLITLPEITPKHLPTLKDSFARGKLAELKSFGGHSLAYNMERVDSAISKTKELSNIYNRNHSEWTRRMINLDHYDPWFNMRQISAEMSSRRSALNESKYRHMKNEVKLRRLFKKKDRYLEIMQEQNAPVTEEYISAAEIKDKPVPFHVSVSDGDKTRVEMMVYDEKLGEARPAKIDELHLHELMIEISEMQEGILNGMSFIEGAMKEVLILEDLYDQLKLQINTFSEADYEDHNARAHLRQAIAQSLRDVRGGGTITKGEQRLLEQIGVNPTRLQKELRAFVADAKTGENGDELSILRTKEFIESVADMYLKAGVVEAKSEAFGFKSKPRTDYMYTDKIGKIENNTQSHEPGPTVETGDEIPGFSFQITPGDIDTSGT
jgi:hypothetical protein